MRQGMLSERKLLTAFGAGVLLCAAVPAWAGSPEQQENHYTVKGRPMIVLQNIVNGRIEVKSGKNHEVVISSSAAKDKVCLPPITAPRARPPILKSRSIR